jgi:hypothetical protein
MNPSLSPTDGPDLRTVAPDRATEIPVPDGVRIDPFTWWALATTDADALIVGESRSVSRVLSRAWPTLRKPVFFCERRRLTLPTERQGTLVLQDAHELAASDQQRLLDWLHASARQPRIVATASHQLFALVKEGGFNRGLYDRLKAAVQLVLA